MKNRKIPIFTACFLLIEAFLYYLILTTGGDTLVYSSFLSIVLCFVYALARGRRDPLIVGGLACTVAADFFLVICSPIQRTWGMVFFLMAQSLYAAKLHLSIRSRVFFIARLALIGTALVLTFLILGDKTDILALLSICYYANLILNIIGSFTQFQKNRLLPMGLMLLILCDTVIGLQVACDTYLPIGEDSMIYRIIFMDFHLSWFFYLPSQILLALSAKRSPHL